MLASPSEALQSHFDGSRTQISNLGKREPCRRILHAEMPDLFSIFGTFQVTNGSRNGKNRGVFFLQRNMVSFQIMSFFAISLIATLLF